MKLLLMLLLFSVILGAQLAGAYSSSAQLARIPRLEDLPTIALAVAPANVAADGGTYPVYVQVLNPDGMPIQPLQDLRIQLFSSDHRAGTVTPEVILEADSFYAVATFTSTHTPGVTTITAMAPGHTVGTVEIKTEPPVGYPTKLQVYSLPTVLLPERGEKGAVIVELQDVGGKPARAPVEIKVSLSSSNPLVGTVDSPVTIKAGQTYGIATFYATDIPGRTTVTASTPGYESGMVIISTVGPTPKRILLKVSPPIAPPLSRPLVSVALLDPFGYPAKTEEKVTVVLTSSNAAIANFTDPYLVIPPGAFYAVKELLIADVVERESVTISAHAKGLESAWVRVTIVPPVYDGAPEGELVLYSVPGVFLPDGRTYPNAIVVQLRRGEDPLILDRHIEVFLSSSLPAYGTVSPIITVPAGSSIGLGDLTTTSFVGRTRITASARDFMHAELDVSSSAPSPVKIRLMREFPSIRATGDVYKIMYVQLQDGVGRPAKAPEDVVVLLSSSNTEVGKTSPFVIISKGATYAIFDFYSTTSSGMTNITASAPGYESDFLLLETIEPFPSILRAEVQPPYVVADGSRHYLVVQLLDPRGAPAKPELPVRLHLSSDNPAVVDVERTAILESGAAYVSIPLRALSAGEVVVTVAAAGYKTTKATVRAIVLPLSVSVKVEPEELLMHEHSSVEVRVTSGGFPVKEALLRLSAKAGYVTESGRTDERGTFQAMYFAKEPGDDVITVYASKPGYMEGSDEAVVFVDKLISVTVYAEDERRRGIGGVSVKVVSRGFAADTVTDETGYARIDNVPYGMLTVTVDSRLMVGGAIIYAFEYWYDGVRNVTFRTYTEDSIVLYATYSTYCSVVVESAYGTVTGAGWYKRGSLAILFVESTVVPLDPLLSKKFVAFTGDVHSEEPRVELLVDSPKFVRVVWGDDYTNLYFVFIISFSVLTLLGTMAYFGKRRRREALEELEKIERELVGAPV